MSCQYDIHFSHAWNDVSRHIWWVNQWLGTTTIRLHANHTFISIQTNGFEPLQYDYTPTTLSYLCRPMVGNHYNTITRQPHFHIYTDQWLGTTTIRLHANHTLISIQTNGFEPLQYDYTPTTLSYLCRPMVGNHYNTITRQPHFHIYADQWLGTTTIRLHANHTFISIQTNGWEPLQYDYTPTTLSYLYRPMVLNHYNTITRQPHFHIYADQWLGTTIIRLHANHTFISMQTNGWEPLQYDYTPTTL